MEVNEVFEKVKNLFVEELGLDADKVTMDAKLEEDLETVSYTHLTLPKICRV